MGLFNIVTYTQKPSNSFYKMTDLTASDSWLSSEEDFTTQL